VGPDRKSIEQVPDTEGEDRRAKQEPVEKDRDWHQPILGSARSVVLVGSVAVLFAILSVYLAHQAGYFGTGTGEDGTWRTLYLEVKAAHDSLQSKVDELVDIVGLRKSITWVQSRTVSQPSSEYTAWTFSADYAGYISVQVESSTTSNTYVRVLWSSYGVNYDETISVGSRGTATFPVLPTSKVEVRVGNSNWFSGATETVTITYHY